MISPRTRVSAGGQTALARLLGECRTFSVEFGPALANHLPMALIALDRLGAGDERLAEYFATYRDANRLGPPGEPVEPIAAERWRDHLGDRRFEADYRAFFAAETSRLGLGGVQRRYLPDLLPGVGASALHALMRLAYANLAGDAAEVGVALAGWATTWLPLGAATGAEPTTDRPALVLAGMRADPRFAAIRCETDLLWHWMRATAREPAFAPIVDRLRVGADTLSWMAADSLALFAATNDFCALHAVTGTHWVRLVPAAVVDRARLIRYFWQAIAAVYPKMGLPALPAPAAIEALRAAPAPDWPEIKQAACRSDDEHDHSLVFSAFEEERRYGDGLYRRVAARKVGLL